MTKEINSISIISAGIGYTEKPALSKIWAIKLGIWDEEYEEQMLKNHPDIYHYFYHEIPSNKLNE